jgi:hypothetical protein
MQNEHQNRESKLQRRLEKEGYTLCKIRKSTSVGRYAIVDDVLGYVVAGAGGTNSSLDLDDVENFCQADLWDS